MPLKISLFANQPDSVWDCALKWIHYGLIFFSVVSLSFFLSLFYPYRRKAKWRVYCMAAEQSKTNLSPSSFLWPGVSPLASDDAWHAFGYLLEKQLCKTLPPWTEAQTPELDFPLSLFSCRLKSYCVFSVQSVQLINICTALVPIVLSLQLSVNFSVYIYYMGQDWFIHVNLRVNHDPFYLQRG